MASETVLDEYLRLRAEHDPLWTEAAHPYLILALRRALMNDDVAFRVLREGFYTKARAGDRSTGTILGPSSDATSAIDHVRDWIVADVARSAPWLSRTDPEGRPLKLLKIGSLARAVAEADKAMGRYAASASRAALDPQHETLHADLGDGWSLVRLRSPEALDRESAFMQHCIGQGAYDGLLDHAGFVFLSLRDRSNAPHATLDLRTTDGIGLRLAQLSGKQNRRPVDRYVRVLRPWLRGNAAESVTNYDSWWSGWIVDAEGTRHETSSLPPVLRVEGSLTLDASAGLVLPTEILEATGDVGIRGGGRVAMPKLVRARDVRADRESELLFSDGSTVEATGAVEFADCTVEGAISIRAHHAKLENARFSEPLLGLESTTLPFLVGSDLRTIPAGVRRLDLHRTAIEALPDGMDIDILTVRSRVFGSLPKGLVVREILHLGHSPVASLPDDLRIAGDLVIHDAHDRDDRGIVLPHGLRVGGDLRILRHPFGVLPDGLRIGGDMVLDGSPDIGRPGRRHATSFAGYRSELPADLEVGGSVIIAGRWIRRLPACLKVRGDVVVRLGNGDLPILEEGAEIGGAVVVVDRDDDEYRIDPKDIPREAPRPGI